ncbi:MAG: DUF4383 domain-containing protein [Usitatibacter sp.]
MKTIALIIGFVLLGLGVACFVPGLATDGVLFGMFPVSMPLAIAFVVTGAVGIMIGMSRKRALQPPRGSGPDMRDM